MKYIYNLGSAPWVLLLLCWVSQPSLANPRIAQIQSMHSGDVACYVDLQVEGQIQQRLANFEICEQTSMIGKTVELFYEQGQVLAASCNGNYDCNRSDTVWLITALQEFKPSDASPRVVSHCFQNESIIFSCKTRSDKVMSVCSSAVLNSSHGYMQYRFGTEGHFPEFVYPMNQDRAAKFFYSGVLTYSGGGGAYLRFVNGSYNYVVYTGIGKGWDQQGAVISQGDDEIARFACRGSWTSDIGPQLFDQVQLVEDPYGFAIPVESGE